MKISDIVNERFGAGAATDEYIRRTGMQEAKISIAGAGGASWGSPVRGRGAGPARGVTRTPKQSPRGSSRIPKIQVTPQQLQRIAKMYPPKNLKQNRYKFAPLVRQVLGKGVKSAARTFKSNAMFTLNAMRPQLQAQLQQNLRKTLANNMRKAKLSGNTISIRETKIVNALRNIPGIAPGFGRMLAATAFLLTEVKFIIQYTLQFIRGEMNLIEYVESTALAIGYYIAGLTALGYDLAKYGIQTVRNRSSDDSEDKESLGQTIRSDAGEFFTSLPMIPGAILSWLDDVDEGLVAAVGVLKTGIPNVRIKSEFGQDWFTDGYYDDNGELVLDPTTRPDIGDIVQDR